MQWGAVRGIISSSATQTRRSIGMGDAPGSNDLVPARLSVTARSMRRVSMGWEMQLRPDVAAGRLSGDRKGYGTRMMDTIAIEDESLFGIAEALRAVQPRRSDSWSTAPWCTAST